MSKKLPKVVKQVWESKIKQSKSNIHVSYSQLSSFATCKKQWYLTYVKKLAPYQASIHAVFGTAIHETIQTWLEIVYHQTAKKGDELDLDKLLYDNLIKAYKAQKSLNGHEHFSNEDEMQMFFLDGKHILDYLRKNRRRYFSSKGWKLAGVETLLYQELKPGVMFKGLVDLVFYHEPTDTWELLDLKTSTSGWNSYAKKDHIKRSQLILYKEYFSKQFNIPKEKISIKFVILKRKVPIEAEYASMQRRVQEFTPPSGKIVTGQATKMVTEFVTEAVSENTYVDKEYETSPSKNNCRWCAFRELKICLDAVF